MGLQLKKSAPFFVLVVVVAAVVVVAVVLFLSKAAQEPQGDGLRVTFPAGPGSADTEFEATGDIDGSISAFSFEAGEDEAALNAEEGELQEVTADNQAISDIGQFFDESEL